MNYGIQYHHNDRDTWVYDVANKGSAQFNYGYYALGIMPEGTQDTASAFIRDKISLTENLTITPGLRFDYIRSKGVPNAAPVYNNPALGHDYAAVDHSGFTPAVSVAWQATSNIRLFADWAYAMRSPNIDELYSTQRTETAPATSRNLHVERNNTINLGADFSFDDVLTSGDALSARVAVFNNHVTNPVARRIGTAHLSGMGAKGVHWYWNLPAYHTSGLEIQTHYENDRMFADLGFSMMTGSRHGAINNRFGPDTYINDLAPLTAQTAIGIKFPDQDLAFGWTGTFVDAQDKTPYNQDGKTYARPPSPGYAVHGLFLDWTPQDGIMKDTELHAAIENIFDKKYEPYLSDGITAMPGRNFKISLSRKF